MYKIELSKKSVDAVVCTLLIGTIELQKWLNKATDKSEVMEFSSILARIEDIQEQLYDIYLQDDDEKKEEANS